MKKIMVGDDDFGTRHLPRENLPPRCEVSEAANPSAVKPVIAVPALASSEERERCWRYGFAAPVSKPVNQSLLRQIVTRWLG